MDTVRTFHSPLGEMIVKGDEEGIFEVDFSSRNENSGPDNLHVESCIRELKEYFDGKRKIFTVPVHFRKGTLFQKNVWRALLDIEYGKTKSYSEIAGICGNPGASRAVGSANNRNPVSIIVPCHRVIGKNGDLKGYAGGVDKKQILISLEKGHSFY